MKRLKYQILMLITMYIALLMLNVKNNIPHTTKTTNQTISKPYIQNSYILPTAKHTSVKVKNPTKPPSKPASKPPELDIPISKKLQEHIFKLCKKDKEYYCLMIAIMEQESTFDEAALSADGHDYGLFQIRDCNFPQLEKELGIRDFKDPFNNSKCAVHMMNKLIDKYEHYNLCLMAYNMGEYGAKKLWSKGKYSSNYSRAVMTKYKNYKNSIKE